MKMIWEPRTAARQRRREGQTLFRPVAPHDLFQPRLVDRDLATLEQPDLGRILVDADDLVAVFSKTRARDEPDVARTDDRYFHP